MADHAARYQALEVDMETGERGGRGDDVERLMQILTGAERTLMVNNNAAAVLLTLAATCAGREVIVSRGEAVEIGGGFRVPDVLTRSGAQLVEVGTTNRTYVSDYEHATNEQTAAYLKVHASNFAVVGFTSTATVADLSPLAAKREVLLIEDVGSGCLLDTADFGLQHEPTLAESISAGADVVCASGDKLLGGPQAGLILGSAAVVSRIAKHPLARALRADKTCLAGLAATLRHYVRGEATEHIPVWWAISRDPDWLEERVHGWKRELGLPGLSVIQTRSVVGGGSLPGRTQPSWALAIEANSENVDDTARRLRTGSPAIVPRVVEGRIAIDARTVLQDEDHLVLAGVRGVLP
jgi:L-seryl-tRNA(Ser) seleniumtransferase